MKKMIYSKKQAQKALEFWKEKLNESCNEVDASEEKSVEENDEQVNEAAYEPNTVGAVINILKRSDPNGKLMIRLLPDKKECILADISKTFTDNGEITMFDVGLGSLE